MIMIIVEITFLKGSLFISRLTSHFSALLLSLAAAVVFLKLWKSTVLREF